MENSEIIKKNTERIIDLAKNIFKSNGEFRLFCIDIDDVMVNFEQWKEDQLERIDYMATKKYREEKVSEPSEDSRIDIEKSYERLDDILEEKKPKYKDLINYKEFYTDPKNLIPGSVESINNLLKSRQPGDYFIFLSHYNTEKESNIKIKQFLDYCPDIDGVVTLSFHDKNGKRSSKFAHILSLLQIPEEYAQNVIIIDNTNTNVKDFINNGGMAIRYLIEGYQGHYNIKDHQTKIRNLGPDDVNRAYAAIQNERENPDYYKDPFYKQEIKNMEVVAQGGKPFSFELEQDDETKKTR